MASFDDQLARMQSLMNYGVVNEETKPAKSIEYTEMGADGNSYAIIKENTHYFIKKAPADKSNILESYEYIDGWNHLDKHEYPSYAMAKKQFGFKMSSLREAYNYDVNKDDVSSYANMELITEGGEEMMNAIARQKQIMYNAASILKEDSSISKNNTGNPEAPKQAESKPESSSEPFTEKAEAKLDKDPKQAGGKPKDQGDPYGDGEKAEGMKDAEYVPNGSVANQKPKGGKVTRVTESIDNNEGEEDGSDIDLGTDDMDNANLEGESDDEGTIELNNDDTNLDSEEGEEDIEGGDLEDAGEEEGEGGDLEDAGEEEGEEDTIESLRAEIEDLESRLDALENGEEGEEEIGDEEEEEEDDFNDEEGGEDFGEEGEEELGDEEDIEDGDLEDAGEGEIGDEEDGEGEIGDEEDGEGEIGDEEGEEGSGDETENYMESISRKVAGEIIQEQTKSRYMNSIVNDVVSSILKEEKTVLHDFGKHPGYRKKPMELPETGSDEFQGNRDWNDDSVHNEQPFGQGKGKSDPYEKIVNVITDEVMATIKKKI